MNVKSLYLKMFYVAFGSVAALKIYSFLLDLFIFLFRPEHAANWPNTAVFTNPISFVYRIFYNLAPIVLLWLTPKIAARKFNSPLNWKPMLLVTVFGLDVLWLLAVHSGLWNFLPVGVLGFTLNWSYVAAYVTILSVAFLVFQKRFCFSTSVWLTFATAFFTGALWELPTRIYGWFTAPNPVLIKHFFAIDVFQLLLLASFVVLARSWGWKPSRLFLVLLPVASVFFLVLLFTGGSNPLTLVARLFFGAVTVAGLTGLKTGNELWAKKR